MGFLRANSKTDSRKQQTLSSLCLCQVLALVRSPSGHSQPRFHLVEIWAQESSLKLLLLLMCQPGGRKITWGSATWALQYGERWQAVPFPCPLPTAIQLFYGKSICRPGNHDSIRLVQAFQCEIIPALGLLATKQRGLPGRVILLPLSTLPACPNPLLFNFQIQPSITKKFSFSLSIL